MRAEVDQAMGQLWTKRVELADDLGKLAPDADQGHALAERMIAAREANRKAQALAMYTDEQNRRSRFSNRSSPQPRRPQGREGRKER